MCRFLGPGCSVWNEEDQPEVFSEPLIPATGCRDGSTRAEPAGGEGCSALRLTELLGSPGEAPGGASGTLCEDLAAAPAFVSLGALT